MVLDITDQYLKYASQPPPTKCLKLRRVSSDPTIPISANGENLAGNSEFNSARHQVVLPEVRVVQFFTPELVSS